MQAINPKEMLCQHWTPRKTLLFLIYSAIVVALICIELFVHSWITDVSKFIRTQAWLVTIVFFSFESLHLPLMACFVPYPQAQVSDAPTLDSIEDRHNHNRSIAFIIPCHQSSDVVLTSVKSIAQHVAQKQIFVIDNGNAEAPMDGTKSVLDQHFPDVQYVWNPYGNKTMAQYAGVILAEEYDYIVIVDDDVEIPANIDFKAEWISERVRAVCYPTRAVHPRAELCLCIRPSN